MGVRPFIRVVTGIEHSDGLYRTEVSFDDAEPMIPALMDGKFNLLTGKYGDDTDVCLYDVFHCGPPYISSLEKPAGVIGYIVGAMYDEPITRALFALWEAQALDGNSVDSLEYRWPQEPKRERRLRLVEFREVTELAYSEGRMYQYFCGTYGELASDRWFKCAIHILHHVGFTRVDRGDLRTYLIFGWN